MVLVPPPNSSTFEQIVKGKLGLHISAVFPFLDTKGSNQCQHQRFASVCLPDKCLQFVIQLCSIRLCDLVFRARELHLADVGSLVSTVDNQVDLCPLLIIVTLTAPAASTALNARDAKSLFNLSDMVQAQNLKGIATPGTILPAIEGVCPKGFILKERYISDGFCDYEVHLCY